MSTLVEMVTEAEATLATAEVTATNAAAAVAKLTGELEAARAAYFATPDDPQAGDAAIALASRLDLAQHRQRAASAKVEEAERSLAAARSTLDSSRLEARKADLRRAASPATLHAATAPQWETFFATSSHDALDAVAAAYAASVDAATELRKLGEHTPALTPWHAFLPWLEREAAAGRSFRGGLEWQPAPETALAFLMVRGQSIPMPTEHTAGLLARVRVLRGGARTMRDAEAVIGAEGEAQARARMADFRLPAPSSAHGRVVTNRS
jgi:hypothetical protein